MYMQIIHCSVVGRCFSMGETTPIKFITFPVY